MKKTAELCRKIVALRGGKSQTDFAVSLDVSQKTVSSWEDLGVEMVPSSESLMRLGKLADDSRDKLYFYKQAGLEENEILFLAKSMGAPLESKVIAVPRLRGLGEPKSDREPVWYVDAKLIPSEPFVLKGGKLSVPAPGNRPGERSSVPKLAYCVVGGEKRPGHGPLEAPGTVIILDTSRHVDTDEDIDRIVLIESKRDPKLGPDSLNNPVPVGLYMGRLHLEYAPGGSKHIVLGCSMKFLNNRTHTASGSKGPGIQFQFPGNAEDFPLWPEQPGITILGRVIAWFRPGGRERVIIKRFPAPGESE